MDRRWADGSSFGPVSPRVSVSSGHSAMRAGGNRPPSGAGPRRLLCGLAHAGEQRAGRAKLLLSRRRSGDLLSPPSLGAFFHRAPVLSYPLRRLRQRIGARTIEAEGAPFYPRKFLHQAGGAGPRSFEGTKPLCRRGISALWLRPGAGAQESDSPARRASVGLLRPWPGLADGRGNVV